MRIFQSALPRGERHGSCPARSPPGDFNPRSREGSDWNVSVLLPITFYFNPRSHEGSDDSLTAGFCKTIHFNPRSREGSDHAALLYWYNCQSISIRAPARGATESTYNEFNEETLISIRAPARGATALVRGTSRNWGYFNPRSREGSDCPCTWDFTQLGIFQSALPRGERHCTHGCSRQGCKISIRAPARGATDTVCNNTHRIRISIRAPARGATKIKDFRDDMVQFQSALPRGERPRPRQKQRPPENFNPRSREGSDRRGIASFVSVFDFNPRSREGSDYAWGVYCTAWANFNPRSREGSDA